MNQQEILNNRLKEYIIAEQKIMEGGQSYTIGDRTLTRASLKEIRKAIDELIASGATINGEKPRKSYIKRVIFND